MAYVDLQLVKRHLNVESDFSEDDDYIQTLIAVADAMVAKELCVPVEELATIDGGEDIPAPLKQAVLLSVGAYYAFREDITTVQSRPLEQGVKYLTQLYRDYSL